MAITYIAIACGSMLTPRLTAMFGSLRKLSLLVTVCTLFALLGMGATSASYSLFLLFTASYWLLCGVQINVYSIKMSHFTTPNVAGKDFGLLANTTLVGAVVGSLFVGDWLHFAGQFWAFIGFAGLIVLSRVLFLFPQLDVCFKENHSVSTVRQRPTFGLWVLMVTLNVGIMLAFIGRFNMSLVMKQSGYSIGDVSRAFALGTLLALPFPWLFGIWEKRVPAIFLLAISLSCVALALPLINGAHYHAYITAGFLMSIMTYCSRGVTQKMLYDEFPLFVQHYAQSLLSTANWVAAIIAFAAIAILSLFFPTHIINWVGFAIGVGAVSIMLLYHFNVQRNR